MRSDASKNPDISSLSRADLIERIRAIETQGRSVAGGVRTGWKRIDEALGGVGLSRGATHEWFGLANAAEGGGRGGERWVPPLSILVHLARESAQGSARPGSDIGWSDIGWVVWIGRRVWPSAHALLLGEQDRGRVVSRALFVAPENAADRLWAIDAALRVRGLVVVADASSLSMAASRRLQLAAEAGGSLGLLARPMREREELSAAATRWEVAAEPSATTHARWVIRLSRGKGLSAMGACGVLVERSDAGSVVAVSSDVRDRPRETAVAS